MSALNLVMPMAGRGSRFARQGIHEPKPLIDLGGKPFFWWAVESVRRAAPLGELVFVILEEHVREWALDRSIRDFYPTATVLAIPEVTSGSAETAALGVAALKGTGPLAINDCDHAFVASGLEAVIRDLEQDTAGTLMTFRADSPNYSFVRLAPDGSVSGTVEKEVASPFAIAGCYLFRSPALFTQQYHAYVENCPYNELFISGMYNQMLAEGKLVSKLVLDQHFAFGTPDEYVAVEARLLRELAAWR